MEVPKHIAFIMDGNRRWAKEKSIPSLEGHKKGYETAASVHKNCFEKGVEVISFFGFSTENWDRPKSEVNYLFDLLELGVREQEEVALQNDYKILISGRINEIPRKSLVKKLKESMKTTRNNQGGIINLCVNYGGQAEIIDAVRKMTRKGFGPLDITEESMRKHLYQDLPYPDIIVRTSGEKRLSGFFLWQSEYSELMFLEKYWPDFDKSDIEEVIKEFNKRKRRFGGN